MIRKFIGRLGRLIGRSPIGWLPVRVQRGPAKGARWTLAPFSYYWRAGGYEADVPAAVRLFPSPNGLVFWDVGAHFGIHTACLAMQVGPNGQVASFEPDEVAYSRLSRHVMMNNFTNVKLFKAAASNKVGRAPLYISEELGSSNSFLKFHEHDNTTNFHFVMIETVRLDYLVTSGAIRPPDIIKLDAQGHGGAALEGAAITLASALPVIAFSNHSHEELSRSRAVLEPLGYQPQDFDGNSLDWGQVTESILVPPHRISHSRVGFQAARRITTAGSNCS